VRITDYEVLDCDLGWRTISFLKITADDGTVGWSEFTDSFGSPGLVTTVESLRDRVVGQDPRRLNLLLGTIGAVLSPAPGGVNRQAMGAIENALLDVHARHLDVPVSELLGGAVRDRIPVYWSHCGNYRTGGAAALTGHTPLASYDDVVALGREAAERGFRGLKTNVISFDEPSVRDRPFGWARHPAAAGRRYDDAMLGATIRTLEAFREGAGPDMEILLDVNFGYNGDGYSRIARAVAPFDLTWLELDGLDPAALAALRARSTVSLGSGESLFGLEAYLPYFEARALDVAIVDVVWNGIAESTRIATTAAAYGVSVAPHNFYGHLATMMTAQFCAVAPNLSLMELDVDGVPWRDDLVSEAPRFVDGELLLPTGPGWGVEVDEDAIRAHPAR
jgi:galactonate dehydratase